MDLCFCGTCAACDPAKPVITARTITLRTTAALSRLIKPACLKAGLGYSETQLSSDRRAETRLVQLAVTREPAGLGKLAVALQRIGGGMRSMTERAALAEVEAQLIAALQQREAA